MTMNATKAEVLTEERLNQIRTVANDGTSYSWSNHDARQLIAEIDRLRASRDEVVKAAQDVADISHEYKRDWITEDEWDKFFALQSALAQVSAPAPAAANEGVVASARELVDAAERAVEQCPCSLAERDSGHRVGCYAPALSEAIDRMPSAFSPAPSREQAPSDATAEDPGKCGRCGKPYELVRPGKSQPTCECDNFCYDHNPPVRITYRTKGNMQGYVCPVCFPSDEEAKCDHGLDAHCQLCCPDLWNKCGPAPAPAAPATSGAGEQYEGVRVWRSDLYEWIHGPKSSCCIDRETGAIVKSMCSTNNLNRAVPELHGPERLAVIEKALKLKPDLFGDPKPIPASERIHELEERVSELERGNQTARLFIGSIKLQLDNALAAITGGGR